MGSFIAVLLSSPTIEGLYFANESTHGYNTTEGISAPSMVSVYEDSTTTTNNSSLPADILMETETLVISETDVKMFSYLTRSFINPIICIFGFVSNSLGVGVLKTQARQQKLSILWYLFALTIADITFLGLGIVDCIPRLGYAIGVFSADRSKYLMAHFRTVQSFFDQTSLHSARYIVVVMSIERLISVVDPLHVKDTWFAKHPIKIALGCVIFNAILSLPMMIFPTVITVEKGNTTDYMFTFKHYDKFMSKWLLVMATFHSFVPMVMLIPINLAIPLQLYRAFKSSAALNTGISKQQSKVTMTVMAITCLYIFLSIPFVVSKILQYVNPEFSMQGRNRIYFWFIADLGRCLGYINGANDFLVYFLASNQYRAVFKAMYCHSCSRNSNTQKRYLTSSRSNCSEETLRSRISFTSTF